MNIKKTSLNKPNFFFNCNSFGFIKTQPPSSFHCTCNSYFANQQVSMLWKVLKKNSQFSSSVEQNLISPTKTPNELSLNPEKPSLTCRNFIPGTGIGSRCHQHSPPFHLPPWGVFLCHRSPPQKQSDSLFKRGLILGKPFSHTDSPSGDSYMTTTSNDNNKIPEKGTTFWPQTSALPRGDLWGWGWPLDRIYVCFVWATELCGAWWRWWHFLVCYPYHHFWSGKSFLFIAFRSLEE